MAFRTLRMVIVVSVLFGPYARGEKDHFSPIVIQLRASVGHLDLKCYVTEPVNTVETFNKMACVVSEQAAYAYLRHNWVMARLLLDHSIPKLERAYRSSQVITDGTSDQAIQSLENSRHGNAQASVIISDAKPPFRVYSIASIKKDFGEGPPSYQKLKNQGVVLKDNFGSRQFAIRFIPQEGDLNEVPVVSRVLSQRRFIGGGYNEFGMFATPDPLPAWAEPFHRRIFVLQHRLVVGRRLHFWTAIPIASSHYSANLPLSEELSHQLRELPSQVEPGVLIMPELVSPIHQEYTVATHQLVHTFTPIDRHPRNSRLRTYQKYYGVGPSFFSTKTDPDRADAAADLALISTEDFESVTLSLLANQDPFYKQLPLTAWPIHPFGSIENANECARELFGTHEPEFTDEDKENPLYPPRYTSSPLFR